MLGVIGGTGFYEMEGLAKLASRKVETPFGEPSGPVVIGEIEGRKIAFLARHGDKHNLIPTEINYRANIWALKDVGVRQIVSISAVGSLRREIKPTDLAIPDQYLDFTKGKRAPSFFGNGIVAHISTAHPSCADLTGQVLDVGKKLGIAIHSGKTYVCVEGPRLGTRAESFFLQNAGCDIVGMTNVPEVFLAREAQICYCTISVITDYDCWLEDPTEHASVDKIVSLYKENLLRVQKVIRELAKSSKADGNCPCRHSLDAAILSQEADLNAEHQRLLGFLKE